VEIVANAESERGHNAGLLVPLSPDEDIFWYVMTRQLRTLSEYNRPRPNQRPLASVIATTLLGACCWFPE
jgi:hypothetical protein